MAYSPEVIEEVRSRSDIVDVIGSYVHLTKKGASHMGLCPFHREKTPSFSVSSSKQIFYCFGCGAGGDVFSFIMNHDGLSFPEAVRYLAERAGITLPEEHYSAQAAKEAGERERIFAVNKEAAAFYFRLLRSPEGEEGRKYFHKRRLSKETMRSFGLGYASAGVPLWKHLKGKGFTDVELSRAGLVYIDERRGISDRFRNRVMFPIMDTRNRVIGFGGRVMGNGDPKYLNSPETPIFDKGRNLYGLNVARNSRKKYLIACEGYMDVISMHQAGFTEAVASLGTAFTPYHANLLHKLTEDVRLTYDSDNAGIRAALRAIPILKETGISTRIIHLEPYKDPDELIKNLGAEEFQKRIEEAENSLNFEIHVLQREYDIGDPEGRTRFEQAMARRLGAISDELERNNYTEAMASEYMIPSDTLKRAVEQARLSGSLNGADNNYRKAEPVRLSAERRRDRPREDGTLKAEKLLLTYLADDKRVYTAIKPYLASGDFSEGMCRMAAELLFDQMEEGHLNPAAFISKFEDPEEQRAAAEILSTELPGDLSREDKEKALTDLVVRIKRASLARMAEETGHSVENAVSEKGEDSLSDPIGRMIAEKRVMEKLSSIRISLGGSNR
ncbi:MAG: DNA primase [Lachnospiraceae bacterium]|nr:DNA primase [Lachnospiraceae bacterium]